MQVLSGSLFLFKDFPGLRKCEKVPRTFNDLCDPDTIVKIMSLKTQKQREIATYK